MSILQPRSAAMSILQPRSEARSIFQPRSVDLHVMATLTRHITLTLLLTCIVQDLALTRTTDHPYLDLGEILERVCDGCHLQIRACADENTRTLIREKRYWEAYTNVVSSSCFKELKQCSESEIKIFEDAACYASRFLGSNPTNWRYIACDASRLYLGSLTIAMCVLVIVLGQMQNFSH
ncbi:unnamed protein product [Lymnaea stagnalis]|uniref:Uncharacterized protein n=1 Tax=Lymnaea stagnalis TaxID=6523 RepID=A0AAV2I588_LYMST